MSRPLVVLIAASDLLESLRARFDGDDVLAFPDADVLRALETISVRRPARVLLESGFASTSRGTALVNRLRADPSLRHVQVEVVSSATVGVVPAVASAPAPQPAVPLSQSQSLDVRGTRRAPRTAIRDGLDIVVDGAAVRLVNLSVVGAQVVSTGILKPNQKGGGSLGGESGSGRMAAGISGGRYEVPRRGRPRAQDPARLQVLPR